MRKAFLVFALLLSVAALQAQPKVDKIEPPTWWTGMQLNTVQLMIYGSNLQNISAEFKNSPITVLNVHRIDNPDYAFIDIVIPDDAEPGEQTLVLRGEEGATEIAYTINERDPLRGRNQGFGTEDAIYLLFPDRFANGTTENDSIPGMLEGVNRLQPYARHGGDIQGIINKLDYIQDLGFTTLWINPLVENNTSISYHGYAATDFYTIDPRFGSNELYKELVDELHKRGMKVILDHVSNHCSIDHPWLSNLPTPDWINGAVGNHMDANHNKQVFADIHSDSLTIRHVTEGWFVNQMPDLNQRNPFVANYIIQNTIWWLEFAGIDGIREDTYPYADQKFLARWAEVVLDEYPALNIVGEVWTGQTAYLATFQENSIIPREFDTNLPAVTDFGLRDALVSYLEGKDNLYVVYKTLAKDFLFADPMNLVTFIDNHDVARIRYYAKDDLQLIKRALTMLLTTRGIPSILYGTEIGMEGAPDHGLLRMDFPGGWLGDERDAFTEEGRLADEQEIFSHIRKLLHLRQEQTALSKGKLLHYPPLFSDHLYYYFRLHEDGDILVAVNDSEEAVELDLAKHTELLHGVTSFTNLLNGGEKELSENGTLSIPAGEAVVLQINR